MAGVIESKTTQGFDTTNDTSITLTKPTGLEEGDLLISVVIIDAGSTQTINTETGWTSSGATATSDTKMKVQSKIADSSDVAASDFTFNFSATVDGDMGELYRVSGIAPNLGLDGSATGTNTLTTTPSFTISVTPTYNDSFLFFAATTEDVDEQGITLSGYATSTGVSFTEDYEIRQNNGTADIAHGIAYGTQSDKTEITSFSYDITGTSSGKSNSGILSVFTTQNDASGTTNLITTTTTTNNGAGSAGTSGNVNMETTTTNTFDVAGTAEQEIWSNQNKNSTTWTNQNKS